MWRLAIIITVATLGFGAGCKEAGDEGDLCDRDEECLDGFVCVSPVYTCSGEDCWGTCERECVQAADCDGGDVCQWVLHARICRPADYREP